MRICSPELGVYSGGQEDIDVIEASRNMSVYRSRLKWTGLGLGTDPDKDVSDNLKVAFQPLDSRNQFPGNAAVTSDSSLPGEGVTEPMFALCPVSPDLSAGAIVAVYVVCWMPYHARRLMYCYIPDDSWTE